MKHDEVIFLNEMLKNHIEKRKRGKLFDMVIYTSKNFPRDIYERLGINYKRACYILEKWSKKGWYDWGVSIDMGWLENDKLKEIITFLKDKEEKHA